MIANRTHLQNYNLASHKEIRDVFHCNFNVGAFWLIYHHKKYLGSSPRSAVSFFFYSGTLLVDLENKS